MSHLIPEKRMNKNGVAVTKHVRPAGSRSAGTSSIPAPSADKSVRNVLIDQVRDALETNNHGITGLRFPGDLYDHLYEWSDKTVDSYLRAINESPGEGFDEFLVGALNAHLSDDESSDMLEIAKVIQSTQSHEEHERGFRFMHMGRQVRTGLRCYPEVPYTPPARLDAHGDPEAVKAMALVTLTLRAFADEQSVGIAGEQKYGTVAMKISNPEIVRYVLDHPDEVDRVADAMTERHTDDLEIILDMMNAEAPSLREGIL